MCSKTNRTRANFIVAFAFAFAGTSSNGQTIGEVAEAQRLKLRAELAQQGQSPAPLATPPQVAPVPLASPQELPPPPRVPEPPKLLLHGLYERSGKWTAEVTDGVRLVTPTVGMFKGDWVLENIDAEGLHLRRMQPCSVKRAKASTQACATARVVRVGEAL